MFPKTNLREYHIYYGDKNVQEKWCIKGVLFSHIFSIFLYLDYIEGLQNVFKYIFLHTTHWPAILRGLKIILNHLSAFKIIIAPFY